MWQTAQRLLPLSDAERFDRGQKRCYEEADQRPEDHVARIDRADSKKGFRRAPRGKAAQAARGGIEEQFFAGKITCHLEASAPALRGARRRSSAIARRRSA